MKMALVFLFLFVSVSSFAQINANDLPSLKEGEKAPDIMGVDTSNATVQLSNVKSKYTLLYFYDFGCRHCDSILPKLTRLYDIYKKQGLEVFAVPLTGDIPQWKEFIRKNNLTWINVFLYENEQFRLGKDYKIRSTPALYLLNKKKKVLGKHFMASGGEVENALKKYIH